MNPEIVEAVYSMHHSKELQEEVYSQDLDVKEAADSEAIKAAYAMHHTVEMQENVYANFKQTSQDTAG